MNQRRLYKDCPTCSELPWRLEHVGYSLYKRRWFTGFSLTKMRSSKTQTIVVVQYGSHGLESVMIFHSDLYNLSPYPSLLPHARLPLYFDNQFKLSTFLHFCSKINKYCLNSKHIMGLK